MATESERVYTNERQETSRDSNDYSYDFEIKMNGWKTLLIIILNILTGGLGTLIEPFLNEGSKKKRIIFASILLSFFQILHFLHGFSLLKGVKFLEDIYDSICDDKFFEVFFEKKENEENDDNNEEQNKVINLFKSFKEMTNLNVAELISKKSRIKFLKECMGIISGMSYCNSIFSILVDFKNDEENKLLSYKIILYSIFNPGAGIILASFALIPSCDCCNGIYKIKGIIICFISIIFGLIIMLTPISLIFGLFLTKITNRMITIFPLKITFIFFGCLGILLSVITSGFNKRLIRESYDLFKRGDKENLLPFDIILKVGGKLNVLRSEFGCESFGRLISNMIIPGSGTMSLICKYQKCSCEIFFTAVIQFIGGLFFLSTILIIFQKRFFSLFYTYIFHMDNEEINVYFIRFLDYFYTIGLCFYFSGILLILIFDYFPDIENIKNDLSTLAGVILNLFTGGLGTILFLEVYGEIYNPDGPDDIKICDPPWNLCQILFWPYTLCFILCRHKNCKKALLILGIVIGGFIGYFGTLYCIFFSNIASKACKITYPIFYGVFSFFFGLLPFIINIGKKNEAACPIKKKINNEYQIINIDDVEIYN